MSTDITHAAIFVDFENIYYFIKNRTAEGVDASEVAIETVRNLRAKLLDDMCKQCIVQHAYADFERIGGSPPGALRLTFPFGTLDPGDRLESTLTLSQPPHIGGVPSLTGTREARRANDSSPGLE